MTIEEIFQNNLNGTLLTVEDVTKKDGNNFVSKFRKQINRDLRTAGYKRAERAFILKRSYSQIAQWDWADDKLN